MSQPAAMFVAAYNRVDQTNTYGAKQYFLGVRDAMEAIFRACHGVTEGDSYAVAMSVLSQMDPSDRDALLHEAERLWMDRRRASIAETVKVM
jgi:hypothetical protein